MDCLIMINYSLVIDLFKAAFDLVLLLQHLQSNLLINRNVRQLFPFAIDCC